MRAHAVIATAPRQVEFAEVRAPEPTADDVVVRVTHSWISNGTEGSFLRGERIAGDTPRGPSDPLPFPHVPGYQKVGVAEWVGKNVTGFRVGDTVFASVSGVEDMFYPSGGHVSPAVTHRSQVWKLPPGLDPIAAGGLVLTQVGYNVGARPAVSAGDAVLVVGDGLVGHWAAQTFQHRGARVLLAGRHDERLARFEAGPGDGVVNAACEDLPRAGRAWAPEGLQVVADTVGSIPVLESLMPLLRRDGHLVSAGFYGPNGRMDIQRMRDREITLHAPAGWTRERMDTTLDLLARGVFQTLPLITHRLPAALAPAAYDLILARREPVLGVILDWGDI
ncbi:MAG: zinc-binding dehydrogenase [Armatimonadetes bacterium]|nr:zinc-binding dehydrogenase [Armatimonadota bacterium]